MTKRDTPWPEGTPNWADLMTKNREASWKFYRSVFGWEILDSGPDMGHYGMATLGGRPVAGIGEPPAEAGNPPPAWTTYLATDDVDKTVEAVQAAGGQVLMPPMDVGGAGRMAMAADPTGAVFGLWQAGEHIGTGLANEPGAMTWNELLTHDTAQAREFYTAVFGYRYTPVKGAADYTSIDGEGPGGTVGGIGAMDNTPPAGKVQAHWLNYFAVTDTDATVKKVETSFGSVRVPPVDTPFGRMAVLADADGAEFAVIQSTGG